MADDEFDGLFSQFDCDKCIAELNDPKQDSTTSESLLLQPSVNKTSRTSSQPNRFSTFVSDQELQEAKKCAVPKNTDICTNWVLNIWKEWSTHRQKQFSSHSQWPTHLMITQPKELDYWLSKPGKLMVTAILLIPYTAYAVGYYVISERTGPKLTFLNHHLLLASKGHWTVK